MNDFTKDKWKCLTKKELDKLARTENIEKMTKDFTYLITEALDECAQLKKFKINTNYKHGLTKETKEMIREG